MGPPWSLRAFDKREDRGGLNEVCGEKDGAGCGRTPSLRDMSSSAQNIGISGVDQRQMNLKWWVREKYQRIDRGNEIPKESNWTAQINGQKS